MSFPINIAIPDAPNDPADDQPLMKQNFANINSFLSVDLVAPGAIGNGFHKQSTYFTQNTPGVITDPTAVAYTNPGVADPTHSQYYYKNSQGIFPLSSVRAFGSFLVTNAAIVPPGLGTFLNFFNVATISAALNSRTFVITLTTGTVNTDNVIVLLTFSGNGTATYTFVGGVLTLVANNSSVGQTLNFLVLQI